MYDNLQKLSQQARVAVQRNDWASVNLYAETIQKQYMVDPEGYFLSGLVNKVRGNGKRAIELFSHALHLDSRRYDSAVELANQYLLLLRHQEAFELLSEYEQQLNNSPLYLNMGAKIFSGLGLHIRAWPLFQKANQLQPEIDTFRANLAACGVLLGKVKEAKAIYRELINKYPRHQKNHYELSKLETVKNSIHVEQMQKVLEITALPPEKNIYMYYAIGKEMEDLKRWKEAFHYYKVAGEAVLSVSDYDVDDEIRLMDKIINLCNQDWLLTRNTTPILENFSKTPIFIVGLPRTGTTLTERIISSHSQVESADETFFMQIAIRDVCGVGGASDIDENIIEQAVKKDIQQITNKYMTSINYRLNNKPLFIDKYPYNYLYLGFIAKAFPSARIVYLRRNPMDACFAMFKQSFFKFAYSLEHLGKYYIAQERLFHHWKTVLGERLIEVEYEALVNDQKNQTKIILEQLGLKFEQSCIDFEQNPASSASASTLQVREKIHSRSVNKWQFFADELKPLREYIEKSGIIIN